MSLASAWATDKHNALRAVSEVQAGELSNQVSISAGRRAVETCKITSRLESDGSSRWGQAATGRFC